MIHYELQVYDVYYSDVVLCPGPCWGSLQYSPDPQSINQSINHLFKPEHKIKTSKE